MKICKRCKIEKPKSCFYNDRCRKDGKFPYCKDCCKKERKEYNQSEKGVAARKRKYLKQKEYMKKYLLGYNRKHYKKRKARVDLLNAVRDGRVKKEVCSVCGNEKSEGHHTDYNKPFVVVWLCKKHHKEAHREAQV